MAEGRFGHLTGSEIDLRPVGRAIAAIAGRQRGLIAHRQLARLGCSRRAIGARIGRGELIVVHRGVYAVGHAVLGEHGRLAAAVLATGAEAVLSHRSAATALEIAEPGGWIVDVTAPTRGGRARRGIRIHRVNALDPADVIAVEGLPCTSVPRTLIDLAAVLDALRLDRALDRAAILRLLDFNATRRALDRHRGRRGVARLRAALDRHLPDSTRTRSELERRFLALCRDAGVRPPGVNVPIEVEGGTLVVDFCWPEQRLIIETDGFATHGTKSGFERDRERAQLLAAAGWQPPLGFTWDQVEDRTGTIRKLRSLLPKAPASRRGSS